MISTIVHGNQILQDSHSVPGLTFIEALQKASAPSAAHDSAQRYPAPKCIEGTRTELLAHLTSWVDEPDQKPICWLNGRPGSGKSAVSQTLAEEYARQKRLAASFFFSRRDPERRTTRHFVPTLTIQLLGFLPSIRPAVVAAQERDFMLPMKVLREQMEKLLFGPLSTATETPDAPLLIVVDALDECNDEGLVSELVTLLSHLPQKTSLPLRLLVTSRPEPWLQSQFHRAEVSTLTSSLEIHAFSADADIRSFLRRALDNTYDQCLQVMEEVPRPWPQPGDLERIVNKADGLFIFALTVVKFVGAKTYNPVLRLQAILEGTASDANGTAYAELDSLYRDAVSTFPNPDVARLVLGLVYCMTVPMSASGLYKLLQRPDVDVRLVVPALSSVLLASEDGKQLIQFYHTSFRDFLINPERSQKYTIDPIIYHRLIGQLCLESMLHSLKRDMCGIGDPSKANCEVPDLVERRQAAFDEALLYACRFWSRHLVELPKDEATNETLLGALTRFGTTVLLHWIEALSLFDELESGVVILRECISWLKTLPNVPEDILVLFRHAERFVVAFMDPICQCALHVYVTAILFPPDKSLISKTFKHQSFGTLMKLEYPARDLGPLRTILDLQNPIHSVVFSPNGDLIATAGVEHGIQMWNVITRGNVASFEDRSTTSLLVRFSPSGAFLAGAFEGGTVTVWDPKVGREHLNHEGCHVEPITCMEFSQNSTLLASGSRDHAIQVWSVETAQALHRLTGHKGPVTSLVFSSDSLRLVSGSEDNSVRIWDMLTGELVREMSGHLKAVNCVAMSTDGNVAASGSEDETIKIWEVASGKCKYTLSGGHYTAIRSVHFFDGDRRVVAVCDGAVISWDVTSRNMSASKRARIIWSMDRMAVEGVRRLPVWWAKLFVWATPKFLLRCMTYASMELYPVTQAAAAYAAHSPSFVFTHRGGVFSGSLPMPMNNPSLPSNNVTALSITSDGLWAATANPLGSVTILDLTLKGHTWDQMDAEMTLDPRYDIFNLVPSPNGGRFVLRSVVQWYLADADFNIIRKLGVVTPFIDVLKDTIQFKFSADGTTFFCVNPNKAIIRVFDAATGAQRAKFKGLEDVHSSVASANGAYISCGHGLGHVTVFNVVDKRRMHLVKADDSPINALLFSNDAQKLIGGSKGGVVRIWDRASGECKATFGASTSTVTALAYVETPDGARVAIGREDGSLCLWFPFKSASHDVLLDNQAEVKNVDLVRFSGNGTRLESRGADGSVFTWAVSFDADDAGVGRCTLCTDPKDSDSNAASPHLLSRSDPEDTVDNLFHTAYRVRKDGWLVNGDRRVLWLPPTMRPRGKDTFYAYGDGSVVLFPPGNRWYFLRYVP